jgi:uncharacterized protein with HEPN domain
MRLWHLTVPWRQIAGLPDVLAHVYFDLEDDTIWQTVSRSVPALAEPLTAATAIELPGPT